MKKGLIIFSVMFVLLVIFGFIFMGKTSDRNNQNTLDSKKNTDNSIKNTDAVIEKNPLKSKIVVKEVEGTVFKKSGSNSWFPVKPGDSLSVDNFIRTENDSRALFSLGSSSTVELSQNAEIEVRELKGAVERLGLIKGRAFVDYKKSGQKVLKIENKDGTVVASVDKGKFVMMNSGKIVAVATTTGNVDLTAAGKTVKVGEGKESISFDGSAPLSPYDIRKSSLLKITAGNCTLTGKTTAVVRGTAPIGSEVFVDEKMVDINERGRFFVKIDITAASAFSYITVKDALGHVNTNRLKCINRQAKASIREVNIDWGKQ
ncbi:MAG: FecR domain-containing protein [Deltaproteobacteria bacterium]|nr:FecR domain-containing protein [Deltaproteobacteria bacterium]